VTGKNANGEPLDANPNASTIADLAAELQPVKELKGVEPRPTDWVVCSEEWRDDVSNGGISSYMAPADGATTALQTAEWDSLSLGESGVRRDGEDCCFEEGLLREGRLQVVFFLQHRSHHGLAEPSIEFTPSFLWYFKAIPRPDGTWYYLTDAGREVELVRTAQSINGHRVEVAAVPLRRYLAARSMALVVQRDLVRFVSIDLEDSLNLEIRSEFARFDYHARAAPLHRDRPSFYRVLGKHVVLPAEMDPCDELDYTRDDPPYPEFIYAVDDESSQPLSWSCREADLSNYFLEAPGAPHYLTPVYFSRDVLTRYTSQPRKYRVSSGGLSCLDLWSLRMDINAEGLVEVYLGDLGKYLPAEERDYWKAFNVPPRGGMREERYMRDFLGEFADTPDPIARLHDARWKLDTSFEARYGRRLFRTLEGEDAALWEAFAPMATDDPSERDHIVTVMAKSLIDAIDVHALREVLGRGDGPSLELLTVFAEAMGGDPERAVGPLRLIQGLRSAGAVHLRGEKYRALLTGARLDSLSPSKQVAALVGGSTVALEELAVLLEEEWLDVPGI
jgi:hypothetical protein